MQCPCGAECSCRTVVRVRDKPGRWRVWDCPGCGRYEESPLDDLARSYDPRQDAAGGVTPDG